MSFRVTVACSRAQGEAIGAMEDARGFGENPPVLVADEPDSSKPDEWLIHAYFDHSPTERDLEALKRLGSAEPRVEQLGEADWVTMSQAGLQPIRAGRFYVHTPMYRSVPPGTIRSRSTRAWRSGRASTRRLPAASKRSTRSNEAVRGSRTSPTSERARACLHSPRSHYGRRQSASRRTSTQSPSKSLRTMRQSIM